MNTRKKILILSANPQDTARLRLDKEVREIEEGLRRSRYRDRFEVLTRWAVSIRDLRRAMLDYEPDIVHFCGHGYSDGVVVEDDYGNARLLEPDALAGLFNLFIHIECVILNACYSEQQAEAINKYIKYVIGMREGITDKAGTEFAIGFYDALGAGKSPEESFRFGCNAIQLFNLDEDLTPIFKKQDKPIEDKTQPKKLVMTDKVPITSLNPSEPANLKQVLTQEDTVLFIGSGISMWSGLPSWAGMIEQLAQFVERVGANPYLIRAEAQKGDLLQAASYGFDKLTKQQIGEFVRTTCRYGIAKPHEIHRKIVTLGPRCFVTTNYDDLIERSLREWQPDRFFRSPITNRHLTETAEIVHARAIDFIFKPHGDAADSDSIILTREQYRQLLPQGERYAALESLKMLLASRPVVYLGFGLRDPDFLYVRDLLSNTYKGGIRDHYAIMADVSDTERDFWRRNYGIHLVSYPTISRADNTRDHKALLSLLDSLVTEDHQPTAPVELDQCTPDTILALARYAAGLARSPKLTTEFSIRVHAEVKPQMAKRTYPWVSDKFNHLPIEHFLDAGPERTLLIGLPGSGKTYSLRRAAARFAENLHEICLSEPFDESKVIVPLWADLKLYQGNIVDLVEQTLPSSLPFEQVISRFKVKFFLDSFNEMPREYWENGHYEADFTEFINRIGDSQIVISSRTNDGLVKLGLPTYYLDEIDEDAVNSELQRLEIELEGRFEREVLKMLQRPFYFQYVIRRIVALSKDAHPRDFYQGFFANLQEAFTNRFNGQLDIEKVLSLVAYNTLNEGEETFPLANLLRVLKTGLETVGLTGIDTREIANWLVSFSVLIPYNKGRIAFIHQSITEYLAATELARRYLVSPTILKEKLRLTRWDQALFLTLSLLPTEQADDFLQDVIKTDLSLALNAVKFLEVGREEVISKLLSEIPSLDVLDKERGWSISRAVESTLPLTNAHEPQLRTLIESGGGLGAAALRRLVALKGLESKDELLKMLIEYMDDFNLCYNGIGPALRPFCMEEDAKKIAEWANSIQSKLTADTHNDDYHGFTNGAAIFLGDLDLSIIRREFLPIDKSKEIPKIHAQILCYLLQDRHSTEGLNFAADLLLRGVNDAATTIHFIAKFTESESSLSWDSFSIAHVDRLIQILDITNESNWAINTLKHLCSKRRDLAEIVKQVAAQRSGIEKDILIQCVNPDDQTLSFQMLSALIEMSEEEREQQIRVLDGLDFDWTGKENLFVNLLKLRNLNLSFTLFGRGFPPQIKNLGTLEIGPIEWWLEWMTEMMSNSDHDVYSLFLPMQLGWMFAVHLEHDIQDNFIAEFNKANSKFRRVLLRFVIPSRKDITIDLLSEDAISFMMADLSKGSKQYFLYEHPLGQIATEQFVAERLLPLLPEAKEPLMTNLYKVLRVAGSRHGRRYLVD